MDDILLSRRSIRKFKPDAVSAEDLDYILRAAMAAPSAGNEQPWHFIVLDDKNVLNAIPKFHPHADVLNNTSIAICICADPSLEKYEGRWVLDCAAATENALIAANVKGLGSVWLGIYPDNGRIENTGRLLNTPMGIVPFSIVAIGHADEMKKPSERYKPERIHKNIW